MSDSYPRLRLPRRVQRVVAARWLFAALLGGLGAGAWAAGGGSGGLLIATGVALYNAALALTLRWRPERDREAVRRIGAQLLLDSLAAVVAVHLLAPLTAAAQFLFLFPLFAATLLSPRSGLFLTAAVCGLGYAVAELLALGEWWPGSGVLTPADPVLGTLLSTSVVAAALLAVAMVLNYLVRTLAGIEAELAESEADYRELANSLEDEVRQRTADLRHANEELNARNRELLRLREIDIATHQRAELSSVLQKVVDAVAEIVPASEAAIFLRDPGTEHLRLARFSASAERRVAAIESLLGERLGDLRIPLREGTLLEYTVRTLEPLLTHDFVRLLRSHLRSAARLAAVPDIARVLNYAGVVALPLMVGEEFVGLLALGGRGELGANEVERVRAFATRAALAVLRAGQERDLREQQAALEQAYLELQRSQEQVINLEKMRAIGEMTSGVAHNFNNALTAILGTAQLVLLEDLPQTVLHRLRIIERTAQDAALLVQRIRAFTKEEPPQTSATDLNDLVTDAVAMTEPRWKHHADRVESPITVDSDLQAQALVEVEPAAIREVLINLILNAVNALPAGGRVTCRTWQEPDWVYVAVRDTGVGMDEDTRRRCFEPFFTTDGERGTGLGLSVAYGIIQRHNGEIRVVSSPGMGTEFFIALPPTEKKREKPSSGGDQGVEEQRIPPLHALIVDDQAMVRQTLGEMLEALGHTATIAADGREAVTLFDPDQHELVITDWGMPGMSGLAVARAVKARSPSTPVVLITGLDATLPAEVSAAAEIDNRLQKPVALRDLARVLGHVVKV